MSRTSKHQDLEKYSVFIAGLKQNLLPDDVDQCVALAGQEANISQKEVTITDFWHLASHHKQLVPLQLTWAVHSCKKEKGDQSTIHLAKHSVARDLSLQDAAVPLDQVVGQNPDIAVSPYKRGRVLVDASNEDLCPSNVPSVIVPAPGEDWYTVAPEQSAIFVNSEGEIELAVICGCSGGHLDVLECVNVVISEAVNDHKGVHPTHGGEMIQYGWNAGACHLHVFGLVKNLKDKKLTDNETLPEEVVAPTKAAIASSGLPPMASECDIKECGYYLDLPVGCLNFGSADQAPAEAYMSQNYTVPIHTDQLYAPYAFNWVTEHRVCNSKIAETSARSDQSGHPTGGNYVDFSL
ncbi:hypothetical protein F5J12DRAFT_957922 [Pisolithus orientalis]|uniref:uncharacterized protein n=1 Tax=Pisolithus orientalis TaxID=936130 RepID=UPI0022244135|nr:uncharacterized protein F5J12DRAFT_957921 [Pisolithus orientalis]XP_051596539.1 uncharacterized protein F5J12DRAFT_957922 [Pisolithus orientalis]KAI5996427.1 hypothetical protein F5J12DRAFT_957921 [Pisolithus orientalis]KAI5996428.1 hypothetical protein F5J12DRAFT_957922 [Pisolithus orientalis]